MAALLILVVLATTIWVYFDASGRDWDANDRSGSTGGWVIGCLLFWIVVFPIYLVYRGRVPQKTKSLTR